MIKITIITCEPWRTELQMDTLILMVDGDILLKHHLDYMIIFLNDTLLHYTEFLAFSEQLFNTHTHTTNYKKLAFHKVPINMDGHSQNRYNIRSEKLFKCTQQSS